LNGGNLLLFAQTVIERSKLIGFLCQLIKRNTILEELEALDDAALVSSKQKTTTMLDLSISGLLSHPTVFCLTMEVYTLKSLYSRKALLSDI